MLGFYNYFYQQNEAIRNGSVKGVELHMDTLGIINGIIDEQSSLFYPDQRMCFSKVFQFKRRTIPNSLSITPMVRAGNVSSPRINF